VGRRQRTTAREQARAELLMEQAARVQAEAMAERLDKLQRLAAVTESLSIDELLAELALSLEELFAAQTAEVHFGEDSSELAVVRAAGGRVLEPGDDVGNVGDWKWHRS